MFQRLVVASLATIVVAVSLTAPQRAIADDVSDVIERVKKSVVQIVVSDRHGKEFGEGSGFCVAPGVVATNMHVLEGGVRFRVVRSDGKAAVGRGIWHYDRKNDIALVQLSDLEGDGNIPALTIASDDSIKVGIPIYVVGNPKGLKFTVSSGIISAFRHSKEVVDWLPGTRVVQTDAATLPGNSGGPWVNQAGEVVGVHRLAYIPKEAQAKEQNFNFAAEVKHLRTLLARERKHLLPLDALSGEKDLTRNWRIVVPPDTRPKSKLWFAPLDELSLTGERGKHLPGELRIDGTWAFENGGLRPKDGNVTAVSLGAADDFHLEGQMDLGREGGMFWLLGWDGTSGYLIREPGLRTSADWRIMEISDGKVVPGTDFALSGTRVTGTHAFSVRIDDGKLNFQLGPAKTEKSVKLQNYREGSIILGTYPSGYGPRPLRVLSARLKAL
jgi:hypothetical protein